MVPGVNLSAGYYNAHTDKDFVLVNELYNVMMSVKAAIEHRRELTEAIKRAPADWQKPKDDYWYGGGYGYGYGRGGGAGLYTVVAEKPIMTTTTTITATRADYLPQGDEDRVYRVEARPASLAEQKNRKTKEGTGTVDPL